MPEETELPDEVALLWGMRDGRRRGPKATLTVDDITRAAIEVADAEGLAAVSMARVAAQLGNSTMALYRHVRSKDELLTLMSDAAMESPPPPEPDGDWRSRLTRWAHAVLDVSRRHPWYARLPIAAPPIGPCSLAWLDSALSALAATSLTESDKTAVVMGTLTYVHGEMRLRAELVAGHVADPEVFGRRYAELLRRLVDPRRLPALSAAVSAGVFDEDDLLLEADLDSDFSFGLSLYLDGVERFVTARAAGV